MIATSFGAPVGGYMFADFGAGTGTQRTAVKALQSALVSLGRVVGSATLKKVAIDGAIGPKTVAAVNLTFTHHIGPGQAPARYRTGNLTKAQVLAEIGTLTSLITTEVARRQGKAAAPAAAHPAAAAALPSGGPASKADVRRLQTALVTLGKVVGSASLKKIKIDGAMGPKTTAAVNLTFTHHIGPGQAPAAARTGKLSQGEIMATIGTLTGLIETEIKRRGSKAPAASTAKKAELVTGIKTAPVPITRAIAKRLQASLVSLGRTAGSALLKKIKVDGAVGPKTTEAVNWAFTRHIGPGQAPAGVRTGNLTTDYVKANAGELARLIEAEVQRRGGEPVVAKKAKKKPPRRAQASAPPTMVQSSGGKPVAVQPVTEPSGEQGYQATDAETGQTAYGKTPEEAVEAAEEEAVAAHSGAQQAAMMPGFAPAAGGSFFDQNKWLILGGVGVALIGAVLLTRQRGGGGGGYYPPERSASAPSRGRR